MVLVGVVCPELPLITVLARDSGWSLDNLIGQVVFLSSRVYLTRLKRGYCVPSLAISGSALHH
jgi:hypothetical protein